MIAESKIQNPSNQTELIQEQKQTKKKKYKTSAGGKTDDEEENIKCKIKLKQPNQTFKP